MHTQIIWKKIHRKKSKDLLILIGYLARSQRHLSSAPRTALDVAVVAGVADAVGELGLEADLAGRVEAVAGLLLHLSLGSNLGLQLHHLFLFPPEIKECLTINFVATIAIQFKGMEKKKTIVSAPL